jgi:hypothetical protein
MWIQPCPLTESTYWERHLMKKLLAALAAIGVATPVYAASDLLQI